jgi:hypothetical protein
MKYFETGFITKRELYDALKQSSGLSSWNPTLDPTKIQAGIYTAPGCFVLQDDFNGTIDDVSSSAKGTIIYFFEETKRWGIISGEDKNKGVYQTLLALQTAYPTATNGDYALVLATNTFFAWFDNVWNNTGSNVAPDALRSTNNLNDLANKSTSRLNLDVYNKKETKDNVGALLTDTTTIDFTYDNTLNAEKITADVKDNSINNIKIAYNADIATSKIKQATITPTNSIFANNDTQDIINNKAQGQITHLEDLLNTRPVGASNGSVYYLTSQPSAIPNYELLSFSPDNSPIDIESITINSTTIKANRLIGSYISSYDVGATIINGGNWLFNFYGYVSHLNSSRFEIDVYKRDNLTETLLFTCETTDFLQLSQVSPELNVVNVEKTQQDFACNTSDKIVVKIYAKTDRSQDTTITLLHSGTDYASHIHTPLIISHNNLAGLQGGSTNERFHLTQSQLTQIENLQNNLDLKENVANKTTTFSATPSNVKYPTEKLVKDNLDLKENLTNKAITFSAIPADIKYPTEKLVKDNLDLKIDKIAGKGLSTNDYTTAEQTKLAGIQAGATANSTDAYLLSRENHTGSQAISTINNLDNSLTDKFSKTTANEINSLNNKTSIGDNDIILIEDESDNNKKKKTLGLGIYNYISGKLQGLFNTKVGISNNETIDGNKTFSTNITLTAIPTLVNHLARIKDVQDSTATISNKIGQADGIATLGSDGKVPSTQLPAYVDDVLEYDNLASFPATGDTGKIYVAKDTNKVYRWSGSQYVEISASLALGETSSTAYRGDLGKIAYDHSQSTGNPHNTNKADIGLGDVDNTSDANKPISTNTQIALNNKQNLNNNLTKLSNLSFENNQHKTLVINSSGNDIEIKFPIFNLSTTERDALINPATNLIIYNNSDDKLQIKTATSWQNIVVAGTGNVSANLSNINAGEFALFNNSTGTQLAKIDGTASQRRVFSKNSKLIAIYSTTERNAVLDWQNNDIIFNSTTGFLEKYFNSAWNRYTNSTIILDQTEPNVFSGYFTLPNNFQTLISLYSFIGITVTTSINSSTLILFCKSINVGTVYEIGKYDTRYVNITSPSTTSGSNWNFNSDGVSISRIKIEAFN